MTVTRTLFDWRLSMAGLADLHFGSAILAPNLTHGDYEA